MKNFPELVGNKAKGESQNGCSIFTKATLLEPKRDKLYMIVIT